MTMFVFSRRAIQDRLGQLEAVLSADQHAKLVGRLNQPGRDRLAAMWEVVFLQALNHVARIRHEVALSNRRQPDFGFELAHKGKLLSIVGDITCVSDVGLDRQNLFRELGDEVSRLARKYRLDPDHFRYDVAGERTGEWPKQRVRLLLPTGEAFTRLIKDIVEPFVRELASSPRATAEFGHEAPGIRFSLRYDQSQWSSGGSHPCYDLATSLTENVVYRALKAKAQQLSAAPQDAIRLVILCDGDCAAMRKSSLGGSGGNYTSTQIATEFLRKSRTVDLVLLVAVEKRNPYDAFLRGYVMHYELIAAPARGPTPRVDKDVFEVVHELLERSVQVVPTPMADVCNAAIRCQEGGYGLGTHGGYQMSGNTIRISARLVQELLAGKATPEQFSDFHRWGSQPGNELNPFAQALSRGELISAIKLIDCGDEDDNQFEFRFGPADPAVSPFRRIGSGRASKI
ncbi:MULTISPECIES: hypothetical protein [Xanthomonas]|uniref:hypothetical protein n=1 Tax=Xanthomonas TaxID=338 RepID=UPI001AD9D4C0|nr:MULTISPECIES: hypothetical protein [unclassified Xanthomonas]MBO9873531.1 hypothetical protein [Xanthomonas sp. D-93]WNH45313.1 hypothetical protein PG878_02230 [Xanthomonas sp. A6251]